MTTTTALGNCHRRAESVRDADTAGGDAVRACARELAPPTVATLLKDLRQIPQAWSDSALIDAGMAS
jgi:hypothetical protein